MSKWSACSEKGMQMKHVSILCQGISFIYETWILGTWPSLQCLCASFPSVHLPKHFWKQPCGLYRRPEKVWSCRVPFLYWSYSIYPSVSIRFAPCEKGWAKLSAPSPKMSTPNSEWSSSQPTRPCSSFTQTWKQTLCFASRLPELQQKGMEEMKSSAEWPRSWIHQPLSSVMDSSLKSAGEVVRVKLERRHYNPAVGSNLLQSKDYLHMHLILAREEQSQKEQQKSRRDKSRGIVCGVDEFSRDNGGSTHTG